MSKKTKNYNTPHHKMSKKTKNYRSQGIEREHKDITCAVRLPKTMYDNLCKAATIEGLSLSDIIRDALIHKMEAIFERQREKQLKEAEFEAKMRQYNSDDSQMAS